AVRARLSRGAGGGGGGGRGGARPGGGGGRGGGQTLLGGKGAPPGGRPPLSKAVLAGKEDEDRVFLRPADWYEEQQINLRLGVRAVGLDADGYALLLEDNERLPYDRLLIVTGAIPRTLDLPGADLPGVHTLRSLDDARTISAGLTAGGPVAVIGAGFIGAEVASVCRARDLTVTVIEPLAVPMARALGDEVGGLFAE